MWYLQIWFWAIEQLVHCVYVVVCYAESTILREDGKEYTSKHDRRKIFQLDLGIGLMEYGICLYWGDVNNKEKKPDWMRHKQPKPCGCGMCFSAKMASQTASTTRMEKNSCVKIHQVEHR